jgi:DNA topoisomerase-1
MKATTRVCWTTLRHDGVTFPAPHVPSGAALVANARDGASKARAILTDPDVDEIAVAFATTQDAAKRRGTYRGAWRDVFERNFWAGFAPMLPADVVKAAQAASPSSPVRACDFSAFLSPQQESTQSKQSKSTKSKVPPARSREDGDGEAVATVDGVDHPISNATMERAGVFLGRGAAHPLLGAPKRRVLARDVTLNLSKDAPIPPVPQGGGGKQWGAIVHDPCAEWLARWRDPVSGHVKYVRLSPASPLERESERSKFDRANALSSSLPAVRRAILRDLLLPILPPKRGAKGDDDDDIVNGDGQRERAQQLAACAWLIDALSIRIGSVSDARTRGVFGATTLLARHLRPSSSSQSCRAPGLELRFTGKDSVPYETCINLSTSFASSSSTATASSTAAALRVLRRLRDVAPTPDARLFPLVSAARLNEYLGALAPGLTAKVVRTHHATETFQAVLRRLSRARPDLAPQVALEIAAVRAAIQCNHRRGVVPHRSTPPGVLGSASSSATEEARLQDDATPWRSLADVRSAIRDAGLNPTTTRSSYIDPRIAVQFCKKQRGMEPSAVVKGKVPKQRPVAPRGETQSAACDPLHTTGLRKRHGWALLSPVLKTTTS